MHSHTLYHYLLHADGFSNFAIDPIGHDGALGGDAAAPSETGKYSNNFEQ